MAALIAMHCLPLAMLAALAVHANGTHANWVGWAGASACVFAITALSLLVQWRKQRRANGATCLEGVADGWRLRRSPSADSPLAASPTEPIEIFGQLDCHYFIVLLARQNQRPFRLLIPATQPLPGQLHRLRVMLNHAPSTR